MKSGERKITDADLDLRVRERNVTRGVLEPKALEKYLAELPDVSAHADTVTIDQPALSGEYDDDEDDEDDEDDDGEAP